MKKYEALIIFSPAITGLDTKNSFEELIKKSGGNILNRLEMGKRFLGYPVKKSKEGYVVAFDFELSPDKMTEFRRSLDLTEDILKYTVVIKEISKAAAKLGAAAAEKK